MNAPKAKNAAGQIIFVDNLDPTNITEENKIILETLFSSSNVNKYFDEQMHTFVVKDKSGRVTKTYKIHFKYPLVVRRDFYGRIVVDVIGDEMGSGSFGSANFILGSLKYRTGRLCYEKDVSWRIMKIGAADYSYTNHAYKKSVLNEYNMTASCPHTNARGTFFGLTSGPILYLESAFSMRQFIGSELYDKVARDMAREEEFSLDDRFKLTLKLLEQFEYQVQSRGVVHRDIKPENIIVFKIGGRWVVNYIDFNLSRRADADDKRALGTPSYVAPEYISGGLDQSSDLYSLILVIALLWRDKCQAEISCVEDPLKLRADCGWNLSFNMFYGIKNLSDALQTRITTLINRSVAYEKAERPKLRDVIQDFSNIYLTYKLESIPKEYHAAVEQSHALGYEMRYQMAAKENEGLNLKTAENLKNNLISAIEKLPVDTYSLREFVECSGIDVLQSIASKATAKDKIEKIINIFTAQYNMTAELSDKLTNLYQRIGQKHCLSESEINVVKLLSSEINYAMNIPKKISRKLVNLDEIADQAARLIFRNNKITHAIKELESMMPTEPFVEHDGELMSLLSSMCN